MASTLVSFAFYIVSEPCSSHPFARPKVLAPCTFKPILARPMGSLRNLICLGPVSLQLVLAVLELCHCKTLGLDLRQTSSQELSEKCKSEREREREPLGRVVAESRPRKSERRARCLPAYKCHDFGCLAFRVAALAFWEACYVEYRKDSGSLRQVV